MADTAMVIRPETVVHRIGGGGGSNLQMKPAEVGLNPPGISVLCDGTPLEAAEQMRTAFPDFVKFSRIRASCGVVGSATVAAIVKAGFDVVAKPSDKFPNHARITHAEGSSGFSAENSQRLSLVFQETITPG